MFDRNETPVPDARSSRRSLSAALARALGLLTLVVAVACGSGESSEPTPNPDDETGAFTVGGAVEGLRGDARVSLLFNTFEAFATGNGEFTFPDRLPEGARYRVTAAPPEGHVCSVENGEGNAAADVRDLRVRCATTDAALTSLVPSVGELQPAFDPAVTHYILTGRVRGKTVLSEGQLLAWTAAAAEPGATIAIAGKPATSGRPSDPVTIVAGPHAVDITVTAPDGVTQRAYTVVFGLTVDDLDYLKASNPRDSAYMGTSLAADGDTLVVGANGESSNATGVNGVQTNTSALRAGAAYVFVRSQGIWTQQAYLKASNTRAGAEFGTSVAISGDTILVGSPRETSGSTGVNGNQGDFSTAGAGAVYVFTRSGSTWSQQAYLKASNTREYTGFGTAVALSGDTAAVGAAGDSSNATGVNGNQANTSAISAGAAYVFTRAGGVWSQQAYLKASNTRISGRFGGSLALSNETLVVGAIGDSSNATGVNGNQADTSASLAGAAYVFTRAGGGWSQQAYLKASNTRLNSAFGGAVAIAGDTLVVGAFGESSNATGVDGNQADTSSPSAGAAYVFTRTGGAWSQRAYLKPSNTRASMDFGCAVAVSGDTILVGARTESSKARGLDGNQADTSIAGAGAAYLFDPVNGTLRQRTYLKASNTNEAQTFGAAVVATETFIAIGARGENGGAAGINGDGDDTSVLGAGAVYVF